MKKVLIVDDSQIHRDQVGKLLEESGYTTVYAVDGENGYNEAVSEMPDLIILDVFMPKENGLLLLERLKKQEETKNIPVIIYSSYVGAEELALSSGAESFILKEDNDREKIIKTVEDLLK